eukprot:gnl/Spiro4/28496_TR14084_c0_g1_i3.p1 gnl/Spiro4/28496_TR14084_c0_g1~~gnl/Spiro4/28496_TR14084_c0_g1_i3.p1  ORF type:complete len:676 (+),score=185.07 gnl/Spiro4/28496_TR14084_c0_g1_i3:40-2067(+)
MARLLRAVLLLCVLFCLVSKSAAALRSRGGKLLGLKSLKGLKGPKVQEEEPEEPLRSLSRTTPYTKYLTVGLESESASTFYRLVRVSVADPSHPIFVPFDDIKHQPIDESVGLVYPSDGEMFGPSCDDKRVCKPGYPRWQLTRDNLVQSLDGAFAVAESMTGPVPATVPEMEAAVAGITRFYAAILNVYQDNDSAVVSRVLHQSGAITLTLADLDNAPIPLLEGMSKVFAKESASVAFIPLEAVVERHNLLFDNPIQINPDLPEHTRLYVALPAAKGSVRVYDGPQLNFGLRLARYFQRREYLAKTVSQSDDEIFGFCDSATYSFLDSFKDELLSKDVEVHAFWFLLCMRFQVRSSLSVADAPEAHGKNVWLFLPKTWLGDVLRMITSAHSRSVLAEWWHSMTRAEAMYQMVSRFCDAEHNAVVLNFKQADTDLWARTLEKKEYSRVAELVPVPSEELPEELPRRSFANCASLMIEYLPHILDVSAFSKARYTGETSARYGLGVNDASLAACPPSVDNCLTKELMRGLMQTDKSVPMFAAFLDGNVHPMLVIEARHQSRFPTANFIIASPEPDRRGSGQRYPVVDDSTSELLLHKSFDIRKGIAYVQDINKEDDPLVLEAEEFIRAVKTRRVDRHTPLANKKTSDLSRRVMEKIEKLSDDDVYYRLLGELGALYK